VRIQAAVAWVAPGPIAGSLPGATSKPVLTFG